MREIVLERAGRDVTSNPSTGTVLSGTWFCEVCSKGYSR